MSTVAPEIERVRALWRSLHEKDQYWVSVKSGSFHYYTDHGDGHDDFAYMIYSDGRQMEINLTGWLSQLEDPDSCHTYSEFVELLETLVEKWLPHYEERYELHKKHVKKRCEELGAQRTWEVDLALQLWEEQMTIFRNIPKLINMFKRSNTYRAENGLPFEGQVPTTSITAHPGATVSTSNVTGDGNVVVQGDSNTVSINTKEDLFARLKQLGLNDEQLTGLDAALTEDERERAEGDPPGKVGGAVKSWLGDITMELAQQGTAVANGVSGSLIANLIWSYLTMQ